MKKHILLPIFALILVASMFITGSTAALNTNKPNGTSEQNGKVSSKEEVVYAELDTNGSVENIYTVNILNVVKSGLVNDYGIFKSLKNLTNTEELVYTDGKVTADADTGRFYYQGDMENTSLPWNVDITYFLNGKQVNSNKLAGANGKIKIQIKTTKNENISSDYYENYLLQISVTLGTETCTNIAAEGGTFANAGSNKLITFTVMPNTDGNIVISTDAADFEMDSISLSAVPFSMKFDMPETSEMTGNLTSLSDAIGQLDEGVIKLRNGAKSLNSGTISLRNGSGEFYNGLKTINGNSNEITNASKFILEALNYIKSSLSSENIDLCEIKKLPERLKQLADGLNEISGGLSEMSTGYNKALSILETAVNSIPENDISEEELGALCMANPENETLNKLIANYKAAQTVKETYSAVSSAFIAVKTNLPVFKSSVDTVSASLKTISEQIKTSLQKLNITEELTKLSDGINTLTDNYSSFHTGLKKYTSGVKELSVGYSDIQKGINSVSGGTKELSGGINELADGTKELNSKTENMPEQLESAISKLISDFDKSDFVPTSFISEKNENVSSVQFVFKTKKIEKPSSPSDVNEHDKEEENFWTRLVNLFK